MKPIKYLIGFMLLGFALPVQAETKVDHIKEIRTAFENYNQVRPSYFPYINTSTAIYWSSYNSTKDILKINADRAVELHKIIKKVTEVRNAINNSGRSLKEKQLSFGHLNFDASYLQKYDQLMIITRDPMIKIGDDAGTLLIGGDLYAYRHTLVKMMLYGAELTGKEVAGWLSQGVAATDPKVVEQLKTKTKYCSMATTYMKQMEDENKLYMNSTIQTGSKTRRSLFPSVYKSWNTELPASYKSLCQS